METIIGALIGIVSSVLSGIILHVVKKNQKDNEEREALRDRRSHLMLEAINANAGVSKELVRCVRGEKPNGELTEAFEYQTKVKHKLEDYIREVAAKS